MMFGIGDKIKPGQEPMSLSLLRVIRREGQKINLLNFREGSQNYILRDITLQLFEH